MSSAVSANSPKAGAVELALAGAGQDQIVAEIGVTNRGTAWQYVQGALREPRVRAVDAYRHEERPS